MTEKMKPSGIGWLGDIPENWNIKPLKYLAECNQRVLFENTRPDYRFRYVDIGSVSYENGIEEYQEMAFEDAPSRARRLVSVGDTIISTVRTYLKAIALVDDEKDVVVSTGFAVYHPREKMDPRFLYYFCKSEGFVQEIDKLSYGIAYPAINTDLLNRIVVSYPKLSEQGTIADFLDAQCAKIDSVIADIEKQIETLQKYKKSVISEVLRKGFKEKSVAKNSGIDIVGEIGESWSIKRLKYLCKIQTGSQDTQDAVDEGAYPFYVRSPIVERIDKYVFDGEAVLMAGDGVGAGRIFHYVNGKFGCHQRVYIINSLQQITGKYLYYYMQSFFSLEVEKGSAKSTVDSIRLPMLQNFMICYPTITEQEEIVEYLDEKCNDIDEIILRKKEALDVIQQHKKSLIYEYVTGKKRVTEVN